jgi:glycosyltransferase involved in cell wall biosynthesis
MTPLRLAKFVNYIAKNGHEVDVITTQPTLHNPVYWIDSSSKWDFPPSVRVHRIYPGPAWHLYSAVRGWGSHKSPQQSKLDSANSSLSRIIKGYFKNILIPDTRIEWLPFAVAEAGWLLSHSRYDLIWSFGFPFTSHLIGGLLSRLRRVGWVAEYGDPWSFGDESALMPRWRQIMDRWLESKLLKAASRVIVCTDETKTGFLATFPFVKSDVIAVVPHGYDTKDYDIPEAVATDRFRIVYTGIFYQGIREPDTFFRALRELSADRFEVLVAGRVDSRYCTLINQLGLDNNVSFLGPLPHDQVVRLQKGASILLSFGWIGGYQIPAKLYEYFGACRPILNIQYDEKDASALLLSTYSRGLSVDNVEEQLRVCLRQLFEWWKSGELDGKFNLRSIQGMEWEASSEQMLKELTASVAV